MITIDEWLCTLDINYILATYPEEEAYLDTWADVTTKVRFHLNQVIFVWSLDIYVKDR